MARNVRFKPDSKGIGDFMRGTEVQKLVRASGDRIADRAGEAKADTWISPEPGRSGQPRAVSGVFPRDGGSKAAERIQQSISAGRI